jgi:hypothetical protein
MKPRSLASATLLAAAALGAIPSSAQPVEDQRRQVRQVIVYGNDPCPRDTSEIVVCARRPESERYRLPPEAQAPNPADTRSALERQQDIREATDTGTDSCSTVGPGGHTGCLQQRINRSRVGMDWDGNPAPANDPDA